MPNLTFLPLQETDIPQEASGLITTFLTGSSWIWPIEDINIYPPPLVPGNVQRVFRQTWTNTSPSSRTPFSTIIAITVDNHFELFINGALVHDLGLEDSWRSPFPFSVPISTDKVTFAVRAMNRYAVGPPAAPSPAGLRAAIQINFTGTGSVTPAPEVFSTGSGRTWVSSRIFGNGWEQPGYNDSDWTPAEVMPDPVNGTAVWGKIGGSDKLWFATTGSQYSGWPDGNGNGASMDTGMKNGHVFSSVELGFMLSGVAVGGAVLCSLITYLLVKRGYIFSTRFR